MEFMHFNPSPLKKKNQNNFMIVIICWKFTPTGYLPLL